MRSGLEGEVFGIPGGPAFPVSIAGSGDNGAHGMSLRDWFAGMALSSVLEHIGTAQGVAATCYEVADAMLEARNAPTRTDPPREDAT